MAIATYFLSHLNISGYVRLQYCTVFTGEIIAVYETLFCLCCFGKSSCVLFVYSRSVLVALEYIARNEEVGRLARWESFSALCTSFLIGCPFIVSWFLRPISFFCDSYAVPSLFSVPSFCFFVSFWCVVFHNLVAFFLFILASL